MDSKILNEELKAAEKRLEELNKQDPYSDPSRLNDNAASDTEAAEEADTASEPPIEMMVGGMPSMEENPPQAEDPTKDPAYVGGFSSAHSGGANFALGDGSVRYLSETIDKQVYQQLGHRADGQLLDEF